MTGRSLARKSELPSLAWFARQSNPLDDLDRLTKRLNLETSESRHLEWKSTPPIGSAVTLRTKYRVVKAAVSFANTEGGFILFGIGSKGQWLGFTNAELIETDLAALAELINGCINPELTGLNYGHISHSGRIYPVLHVPQSAQMPHLTTKDIPEKLPDGKTVLHLNRYAIYCRYSAKSDLATPTQLARIIEFRTEFLKSEMLRRVKEVQISSFTGAPKTSSPPTILRVAKGGKNSSLPAVRITRDPTEAAGMIVTEELSDGLFNEINNVVGVNTLLARNRPEFVFGQEIYYRIYAERQHIQPTAEIHQLLSRAAAIKFYAPLLYWLLKSPPEHIAALIKEILSHDKSTNNRIVCRLAILLGPNPTAWLKAFFDRRWAKHPQPPEHYFYFKKLHSKADSIDRRLAAIQVSANAEITFGSTETVRIKELLKSPQLASTCLSKACMSVFDGNLEQRSICRQLDVLAYGHEMSRMHDQVLDALEKGE